MRSPSSPLSAGVGEIDVAAAAAVDDPPNPNEGLNAFLRADRSGDVFFDADAWQAHVEADASWTSASWTSATWVSASWVSATWVSWVSSVQADSTWADATWVSATWVSASWVSGTPVE